jgi:hypothetical protein
MRRLLPLFLVVGMFGCGPMHRQIRPEVVPPRTASLWTDVRVASRDLFGGAGGEALAPPVRGAQFEYVARKTSGKNPGFEVRDRRGRRWSVKLGEEAQPEVVASRILWAMGYHQPPTYYVAAWHLTGAESGRYGDARFRLEPEGDRTAGNWSWYENPFVGSQAFQGLVVLQLILNNWDLKTSNNHVYASDGRSESPQYVVRDLGAALGGSRQFPIFQWLNVRHMQGSKNDVEAFESMEFITKVEGDRVKFAYRGLDGALVDTVKPDDVVWTCRRLMQITDRQWSDAFRAGGYTPDRARRYILKMKEKINEGLSLASESADGARLKRRD